MLNSQVAIKGTLQLTVKELENMGSQKICAMVSVKKNRKNFMFNRYKICLEIKK